MQRIKQVPASVNKQYIYYVQFRRDIYVIYRMLEYIDFIPFSTRGRVQLQCGKDIQLPKNILSCTLTYRVTALRSKCLSKFYYMRRVVMPL
jgi:hypothetical protein